MAQQNPPSGQNPQSLDPNALRQSLRDLLDDQGDFNNLLKNAISDLKKMDSAYGKIESRLASLAQDSINIKQVNQELLKLKQKEFLENKKLQDFSKITSQSAKDTINTAKQLTAQITDSVIREKEMLDLLESQGDIEAIALYAAEKQVEIAKKRVEEGTKTLQQEKQVSRQLGISGNLVKIFAEKLGVGEDAYSAMTVSSRKLVEQQQGMNKLATFFSRSLGSWKVAFTGIGSIVKSAFSSLLDPAAFIPIVGGLVKGIISVFDYIVEVTSEATKFGRQLGMSTQEAIKLNTQFNQYSITQGSILANSRSMFESQIELGKALGVNNILSKEILDTNIQLKQIAGLDEETRARIAETSLITGKNAKDVTKSVLAQVVGLKQAAGISLNYQEILSEASKMGGYLGLAFAKYPDKLAKSLVTVKAMGVGLKELDGMADSFLDFESSISKEFEAQLLTGKALNLSKARELFLNNDLAGAAAEITSQVGSSSDFMKMNRIAAQSLAESMGMTRDSMAEMLKKQEVMSKLGAKDTDNAQKQYQLALKKFKTQEAMVESLGEEAVQNMLNASNQEKIAGLMDKIKSAIANFVQNSGIVPMIDKMINFISQPSNIVKIAEAIKNTMATVFSIMGHVAAAIMKAANFFGAGIDESIIRAAKMGGDSIRAIDFGSMAGNVSNASVDNQKNTSSTGASSESNSMKKMNSSIVIQNNVTSNNNVESLRWTTNTQTGYFSVPQKG